MDRRYSPITDLYGPAPEEKPPRHGSNTGLYLLLAVICLFVYESLQPVMRLRSDPPPSVVGTRLSQDDPQYESQLQMARACWNYAIESVQNAYPFGKSLPESVPPRLKDVTGNASDLSLRCWPRLRNAWTQPESWVKKYEWDTSWITDPNSPFRQTLHKIIGVVWIYTWK